MTKIMFCYPDDPVFLDMLSAQPSSVHSSALHEKWFQSDEQFHLLFPLDIRSHARWHWTPLEVAREATAFLTPQENNRILDIGSGVGKFCLMGAHLRPDAIFLGIEQRENLYVHSENARKIIGLKNTKFMFGNFTQLDFRQFDHFYFYNAFHEHLDPTARIDAHIKYSLQLYYYYNRQLLKKMAEMPSGTRLATYYYQDEKSPDDFLLIETRLNGLLKFWVKV